MPKPDQNSINKKEKANEHVRNKPIAAFLTVIILGILLFALTVLQTIPRQFSLEIGDVAPEMITAGREVVDEISTEELRAEASDGVNDIFKLDDRITSQVEKNVDVFFAAVLEGKKISADYYSQKIQAGNNSPSDLSLDELESIRQIIPVDGITDDMIFGITGATEAELINIKNSTMAFLNGALNEGIQVEQMEKTVNDAQRMLDERKFEPSICNLVIKGIQKNLQANMLFDEEGTLAESKKAEDAVQPVVYKKGQAIIREGDIVNEKQLALLKQLGVVDNGELNYNLYIGIAVCIIFGMIVLAGYTKNFEGWIIKRFSTMILISAVVALTFILSIVAIRLGAQTAPVFLAGMLVCILVSARVALMINLITTVLISAMMASGVTDIQAFYSLAVFLFCGSICIYAMRKVQNRSSIMLAGITTGIAGAVLVFATGLITGINLQENLVNALTMFGNGVLCSVLCIGTLPIWEAMFNVLTPTKMLELCNTNQQLIKQLMMEAPGTYYHSVVVANLSEAAAYAVSANPLLARVGAFYHDIGKLRNPYYFKENQLQGVNPHDEMDPMESYEVISSHPADGLALAQKGKLPRTVCEIIHQHHGDTLMTYFYNKALESGKDVSPDDYRYNCPRPQGKEAAIIMLADTVEAAVRAAQDLDEEKMRNLVEKLVYAKVEDGQLNNCPLTLLDIRKISDAFCTIFESMMHKRIEYPDIESVRLNHD